MVHHRVKHQPEVAPDPGHIRPITQRRVHLLVIHHRVAVVRGVGAKGQQMHNADRPLQMPLQHPGQRLQRRFRRLAARRLAARRLAARCLAAHHIPIGNQQRVALVKIVVERLRLDALLIILQQRLQPGLQPARLLRAINESQQLPNRRVHLPPYLLSSGRYCPSGWEGRQAKWARRACKGCFGRSSTRRTAWVVVAGRASPGGRVVIVSAARRRVGAGKGRWAN